MGPTSGIGLVAYAHLRGRFANNGRLGGSSPSIPNSRDVPGLRPFGTLASYWRQLAAHPALVAKCHGRVQITVMDQEPTAAPDDAETARQPIADLLNNGRLLVAINECAMARLRFPQDPWLATMQAYIHLIVGDMADAAAAASEALSLGSEDPLAWLVLGATHRHAGRHEPAVEALAKARLGLPDRVDAATMLIEETALAFGVEHGKQAYEEVFAQLPDPDIRKSWARRLWAEDLHDDLPPGAVSAPLMSVRQWVARSGAEPDFVGAAEVIRVEDPPIFGDPAAPRFAGSVPGYVTYATALSDATIFAKSSIILTADGCALNDTLTDERFGHFVDIPHETLVMGRTDERLLLDVASYQLAEIDAAVMLSGAASDHFGHWVPEYLCRLAYLERHPRFAGAPIIVDSGMPAQHLEFLALLVPNRIVQIPAGGALRCRELIVASPTTFFPVHLSPHHDVPQQNQGGLSTGSFRFIQERVRSRMGGPGPQGRKLYLSRKNSAWRRLSNEEEVSAALAARGFEVIYPEDMSFPDQVRMFQSAGVVVAPNGSSLMNAIYASTDLKLIVLSQRGLFNWGTFNGCMRELGYRLTFLCGDSETDEKHGDYAIPLDRLIEALDAPAG